MNKHSVVILGIETSCDETAAAVIRDGKVLANIISSQKVHEVYGGVVPELASRAHQASIIPTVEAAIKKSGIEKKEINAIAFTKGPGLMGSLLVGTSFAKSFSLALDIPLVEINHMQAHILAHFIKEKEHQSIPTFPFLCLTVSGGHTQIVLVNDYFEMEIIGETIDDAAGEAFDKTAKILGLPYPGGPMIDKFASTGNPVAFHFPEPATTDFDFSFSGIKTSFLYFINDKRKKNKNFIEENKHDLCASIQHTITNYLMNKLDKAIERYTVTDVAIAGGVSANSDLQKKFIGLADKNCLNFFIPKLEYCTDNAGMIAMAGYLKYIRHEFSSQKTTPLAQYAF